VHQLDVLALNKLLGTSATLAAPRKSQPRNGERFMNGFPLKKVVLLVVLCVVTSGVALASMHSTLIAMETHYDGNDPVTDVPFPTAGDAYCSATNGCGTIPSGGQTAYQWTAGDFVQSAVFTLPTTSVTDLTADWIFQDVLGGGNSETWFVYVNGIAVAAAVLPDCGYCGSYGTVTGTVSFADIAPLNGGYQVELILTNTIPPGGGSAAWADGGITGLSYASSVPEPGSLLLLGSGVVGLAGMLRRKLT
jgi:PEP-CTERM motif-containing protein